MKMFIKIIIAVMLFLPATLVTASDFAGESMAIGVGARPLGMGGTFAAIADDASTTYWNSAGMTNIVGVEVSSVKLTKMFNELDTAYTYVNLVYNVSNDVGAFGVAWLRQSISDIQLTDGSGTPLPGLAETSDNTIYIAYAHKIIQGISVGVSTKILVGSYPSLTYASGGGTPEAGTIGYTGFGVDVGFYLDTAVMAKELKGLSLGVNLQDVYTTIVWDAKGNTLYAGGTETVALNAKPGIAYNLPFDFLKQAKSEIILACDLDTKYQTLVHVGGEFWWNKMIGIRGGAKIYGELNATTIQTPDWSLGASFRWFFIGVDYAYVYNELAPVNYLSIIGKF